MDSTLITNARIVTDGRQFEGDVLIEGDRISAIGGDLSARTADRVIDAAGRLLIPGMIDDQVHFREPGMPDKGDIATDSAAAVAGGITSFMDMPNTRPNTLTQEILEDKYALAAGRAHANYAFYLGASNDNLEDIKRLEPGRACGIKVFMGASTGNMLVDNPDTLDGIFAHAPTMVVTHCEDTPTILANEQAWRERYGEDVPFAAHGQIRSVEACYKSSSLAVELARKHGTRLHILHLSTGRELELFSTQPLAEKQITAEACVHFLWFSDEDYAEKGALIKCNPAIKTAADRAAILQGLKDGRLDVIGTDHAPHTWAEKQNSYFKAPSGLPLVQHALPVLLELHRRGDLDLELIVEKTSHAVAERFRIEERGYIREGYYADLALIDLEKPWTVERDNVLYKCGWSPFEGTTFHATIDMTWVNGRLAWADGRLQPGTHGQRLKFSA
ncbi:MAG: dihydroorotase [Gammaproteobacteria bacterium]|jgi:dihydroorotase